MNSIERRLLDVLIRVRRGWMPHLVGFVVGALAFLTAQASHWLNGFHGQYEPWFLNSGRAILLTLGLLWTASALTAALVTSSRRSGGVAVAGGAFVAMAAVLFTSTGADTLFPIVLAIGGATLLCSSVGGAWAGVAASALCKRGVGVGLRVLDELNRFDTVVIENAHEFLDHR
mgnify:CR=1 FL=1|jgi:hypothetical protein